ncbi:hypothetical protein RA307_24380 [Xanthobacteraceae bacterium Astr-EGSB]|uniref:hypothetical protein n=1 Tax=Astrobacterium formosum TaxID=3069710 RepID=UPI0027AFB37D|nr:hypothetical protein [Xanthobacteraceae bacterium Astr-EGSB]
MNTALQDGVRRLETTMRVTLAVLALASGVYTYLGVRDLLNGNATLVMFAAVIYSVAVTIGIYAFWSFLMRLLPHLTEPTGRSLMFGCMALGAVMIIAMSAWLNASALAGAAAIQQHLAVATEAYTRDLGRAHSNALAAQGLLPDIQMASSRFAKLAESERAGSLTGTAGSGTVVQLLDQMSGQLSGLAREVEQSAGRVTGLFERGGKHLAAMRELISGRGPVAQRSDAFGAEALGLAGVIAALQQTSVAPAVKRAADGLAAGFIAPAPDGRTSDLAQRQTAVVSKVQASIAAQADSLAGAAQRIIALPVVEPPRFQPLSSAEAVVRYAGDFIPSWAGAISIDLMPGVLVLILCVVHAGIRRQEKPQADAATMTAAELIAALRLVREVGDAQALMATASGRREAPTPAKAEPAASSDPAGADMRSPVTEADENVTLLRNLKKDGA